jgi:hypothetical protein
MITQIWVKKWYVTKKEKKDGGRNGIIQLKLLKSFLGDLSQRLNNATVKTKNIA